MKLDFYYYSYQCPLNDTMIQLLRDYKDRIDISIHDISKNNLLAEEMNIFFPTLIVINEKKRYYSPLRKSFLEQVARGIYPEERPFLPQISKVFIEERVEPLKLDQVEVACDCCNNKTEENCKRKKAFLAQFKQNIFGFIHKNKNGELVGGVEYLPAEFVPYQIPHDQNTAFITCVYMTDSKYDYKSAPLKALEEYLSKDYTKIILISDELGVFPNGDLDFFIRSGYQDEGVIFVDENYCRLHLVSKRLSSGSGVSNSANPHKHGL